MTELLEVRNLKINFKTDDGVVQAARGVNFSLEKGETLAIVGESGSGKSQTVRAVMGLLADNGYISDGEIIYDGLDLAKIDKQDIHKYRGSDIVMIFQDPISSLNPTMIIGKQILEAVLLHNNISKKEAKNKVLQLINQVGIDEPEKRYKQYPHQFSGGMRQRIVIAIALACNPKILICDEPTTALDVTIQAQILDLIKELQEKTKVGVIFITHDLGVVANIADRVAVMYAGKIVEYGKVDEIFYNPKHPYTWGLLASMPDVDSSEEDLYAIPGTPPNLLNPPIGDAFAVRNEYAMDIDFEEHPPFFKVSDTHFCASWLLHESAPKVNPPKAVLNRMIKYKERYGTNE
ncbi:ABC transporter ATP-binding protein [Clostridiaceae bacterium M8S5]|nr:ABC transporter ATP-binding protein [Clostridiaceae bacterium M8S5]